MYFAVFDVIEREMTAMRKAFWAVVTIGLFLLLLSALVVTPETAVRESAPALPVDYHAVLMTPVCPVAPDPLQPAGSFESRVCLYGFALLCAFVFVLTARHDSNGRILTAARYENSVYQVFRPEVAGG